MIRKFILIAGLAALISVIGLQPRPSVLAQVENPQSGSIGLEGKIPSDPPSVGATITFPTNGQVFTEIPITVTGICPNGLLVKLFKNNVFSGSAQCTNGNFSIVTDLFSGQNDLIARVYDSLDQAGPDSNTVTVFFNEPQAQGGQRVSLTSNYAKRGVNPGETLTWPLILSGGSGPYAISVDWGDNKPPDLISLSFPGNFTVSHIYDAAGIYNIVVKASDSTGGAAFLQLVGVANGPVSQTEAESDIGQIIRIIRWPTLLTIPLILLSFWLGRRYERARLRRTFK